MRTSVVAPHLPSGGSQFSVTAALSLDSEVILQASTDDTGGDREVLVVAVYISSANCSGLACNRLGAIGGQSQRQKLDNIRNTGLLPGESHCECEEVSVWMVRVDGVLCCGSLDISARSLLKCQDYGPTSLSRDI